MNYTLAFVSGLVFSWVLRRVILSFQYKKALKALRESQR